MAYKPYRPPHWYDANQAYFLTASTFDRQRLFPTGDDKTRLHGMLVKQSRRFGLRLHAWVILDNHYHLLLRNSAPTALARFVKAFHSESAVAWNRRHDTPGRRVWHNYWDRSPRGRRDYFAFFNYIHFNPVKHGYVRIGSEFVRSCKNRWHLDRSRGDDSRSQPW